MGMKERVLIDNRLSGLNENERLFRINAGMGWTGTRMVRVGNKMVIENPMPLHAAPEGWGDLCGFTSVTVTPDMVGQKIAVFTMEEAKTGKLQLSKMQKLFRELVERMGGIYRVIR